MMEKKKKNIQLIVISSPGIMSRMAPTSMVKSDGWKREKLLGLQAWFILWKPPNNVSASYFLKRHVFEHI